MLAVAAPALVALLFADCSGIVNPPSEPLVSLDAHFFGCFCRDPESLSSDFICIVPEHENTTLAYGTGRGLLPGMAPSDAWDFSGANERGGLEMARILYIDVWGDDAEGAPYQAVLGADNMTLALRERFGIWEAEPLTRCGG